MFLTAMSAGTTYSGTKAGKLASPPDDRGGQHRSHSGNGSPASRPGASRAWLPRSVTPGSIPVRTTIKRIFLKGRITVTNLELNGMVAMRDYERQ